MHGQNARCCWVKVLLSSGGQAGVPIEPYRVWPLHWSPLKAKFKFKFTSMRKARHQTLASLLAQAVASLCCYMLMTFAVGTLA